MASVVMGFKRGKKGSFGEEGSPENRNLAFFPGGLLQHVLAFVKSRQERNSVSLVCKEWYMADRWSRADVYIGNCYSVSPEILVRRFRNICSVSLKGKPRFSDIDLVPEFCGANVHCWPVAFASAYPFLEELRLKRMTVTNDSLELLARSFPAFKALSLARCDGFSTNGLASIARYCRNFKMLDIHENDINDLCGSWLSCFPENFTSLEVLNFATLNTEVNPDALESLVARCKSLRVLKVNRSVTSDQLVRLLDRAAQLTELGTGMLLGM